MLKPVTEMCRRITGLETLIPEQAHIVSHDAQALRHAHVLKAVHEALSLLPALPKPVPPRITLISAGLHRVWGEAPCVRLTHARLVLTGRTGIQATC